MDETKICLEGGIFSTDNQSGGPAPVDEKNKKTEEPQKERGEIVPIFATKPTNQLATLTAEKPKCEKYGTGAKIEHGEIIASIREYSKNKKLKISTCKLLDVLIMRLTKQIDFKAKEKNINPRIEIPLVDYMELLGKPLTESSVDKNRRIVKQDLQTLYDISLGWKDENGKDFDDIRICERKSIKLGLVSFTFTMTMANYLANKYIADFPTEILKIDERNGNAYPLAKKLAIHSSIDNNIMKGTNDRLKVELALPHCPFIPTYDEVKESNRHFTDRINKPFINALEVLQENTLEYWHLETKEKEIISKAQAEKLAYDDFKNLYLIFKFYGQNTKGRKLKIITQKEDQNRAEKEPKNQVGENK